jgi:hypothetical protein
LIGAENYNQHAEHYLRSMSSTKERPTDISAFGLLLTPSG